MCYRSTSCLSTCVRPEAKIAEESKLLYFRTKNLEQFTLHLHQVQIPMLQVQTDSKPKILPKQNQTRIKMRKIHIVLRNPGIQQQEPEPKYRNCRTIGTNPTEPKSDLNQKFSTTPSLLSKTKGYIARHWDLVSKFVPLSL